MSRLLRLLDRLHTAPGQPRQPAGGQQPPWRAVLPVAVLGLVVAGLLVGVRAGLPGEFDPTAPFVVGHTFGLDEELRERGVPVAPAGQLSEIGYDGQWFLGQANDPLILTDIAGTFDAPRYRSIRVLYPAAGWLLAAGQPPATPYALLAVGMLAVGLGCAACARIVSGYRRSPWWGATFALIPGVLVGVGYATAEPLGVALAALGVSLTLDHRFRWAGLAFAGAALTRETYVGFALATAVFLAVDRHRAGRPWLGPAAAVAVPGVATLLAWWGYVNAVLPPEYNPNGTLGRFSVPLVGWVELLVGMVRGDPTTRLIPFPLADQLVMVATFGVLVAGVVLAFRLRQTLPAYLSLGWGLYGLMIAGFLLARFGSAHRALAPAVLAAGLFLVTSSLRAEVGRTDPVGRSNRADLR
jgi:hypothetical protein